MKNNNSQAMSAEDIAKREQELKDKYQQIKNKYLERAEGIFKTAKGYSTQFYNNCLPKNCIYGKPTKNLVIYIDDFEQFEIPENRNKFIIYVLDKRKDTHFRKTVVSRHTPWFGLVWSYIDEYDLYKVKCIPVFQMKRGNSDMPYRHTNGEYIMKVPFVQKGGVSKTGWTIPTPEELR